MCYAKHYKNLLNTVGVFDGHFVNPITCSPAPDIEWISPDNQVIKDSNKKYEIIDYGRILKVKDVAQSDEGIYMCKGRGKTESNPQRVFLNVTCKFF
jgi:hypothetical protein